MSDDDVYDPVADYDDDALFAEVRRLNPDAGPVVDSTRGLYRNLLRRSIGSPGAVAQQTSVPTEEAEEALEHLEKRVGASGVQTVPATASSKRSSRGRPSTEGETRAETSRSPVERTPPVAGLKKRHGRRVSFDSNVEWVQNDPEDALVQPRGLSYFAKAVLFFIASTIVLTLLINVWTASLSDAPEEQLPASASNLPSVNQTDR